MSDIPIRFDYRKSPEFYASFQKMRDLLRDFTNDEDMGCCMSQETWNAMRAIVNEAERY